MRKLENYSWPLALTILLLGMIVKAGEMDDEVPFLSFTLFGRKSGWKLSRLMISSKATKPLQSIAFGQVDSVENDDY